MMKQTQIRELRTLKDEMTDKENVIEEAGEEWTQISELEKQGHHPHCARRMVWGDGECECEYIKKGYNPYAWMEEKP